MGSMLFYIDFSNIFLNKSPQASETKTKNKQRGLYQTKKLLHKEGKLATKWKDNLPNGRKCLQTI